MINDFQVDRDLVLSTVANNLNITEVNKTSGVYKIVEPLLTELEQLTQFSNNTLKDLNINTASSPMLQKIGSELNIFKKNFNTLEFSKESQVISLKAATESYLGDSEVPSEGILLFTKNSSIIVNNFTLLFLEDVFMPSLDTDLFISARLTLLNSNSFYVSSNTEYSISSLFNTELIPSVNIKFFKNVGLSKIEESLLDFRFKLLNLKEMPFKNVNSILRQALQELPIAVTGTIVNSEDGTNSHTIYVSTPGLFNNGFDTTLEEFLLPAYSQAISERLDYATDIVVETYKPLLLSIELKKIEKLSISLEDLRSRLNTLLQGSRTLTYAILASYISNITGNFIGETGLTLELKSKALFESDLVVDAEIPLELATGRFFYITGIREV